MSSASRLALVTAVTLAACLSPACSQAPPSGGTTTTATPPGGNPYAENRAAMVEGRQLFVRFNCSGCHGGRAGGGMGPSLRDVDWIYGNDDARIYSSIAQGRAHGMPAWESRMTADQIWKLVTYIKSLRTSNEPSPPSSS